MSLASRYRKQWKKYTAHWESQIKKHRTEYQIGGAVVAGIAGTLLGGPALGGKMAGVVASTTATLKARNKAERDRRAIEAAATERSQAIDAFQRDLAAGGEVGLQVTPGITGLIPLVLILGLVGYVIFKW